MSCHTNAEDFNSPDVIGGRGDWRPMLPLLSVPLDTWIGDFIYGFSSFDLGINRSYKEGLKGENFFTNIWMVPPCVMDEINCNFPLRAIGSLGGEHWNFSIGRDKLSWGPGESGNLMMGDHIPYHNNARFTGFSDKFKYTFSMSSFTHPLNYLEEDMKTPKFEEGSPYSDNRDRLDYWQSADKNGISMFIAHRLEWRIIDKIGMALTESIMYQSENNKFDLMILSPTAVFHNYYIRGNANSLLSFDIDYTPIKYLNLYGSLIIDEFRLPGECDPWGPPSAHGWILGAKTGVPLGDGMLYGSLEAAYTDPYLYLRDRGGMSNDFYGINFVVATPEFGNGYAGNYTLDFLGYRYGNDSVVANLNAGYEVYGKWYVDAEYTYLADGTMDMHSKWWDDVVPGAPEDGANDGKGSADPKAPTSSHPKHGSFDPKSNWEERNAVAHWNILSFRGGITLFEDLSIWGEMNYVNIINFRNVSGAKADDFQISVGMSYYV